MQVSLEYAEEHLSDLVAAADKGEVVEITRSQMPALTLTASIRPKAVLKDGRRVLGAGRGEMRVPNEDEWRAMDAELEDLMNNSPLFPVEKP